MPCNCIQDLPTYPQNEDWGPNLWLILHTLAERAGKQPHIGGQEDEKRAWPLFMKTLGAIIPCPYCKEHFLLWLAAHRFNLPSEYGAFHLYITMWFYALHEDVNRRTEKPSFPIEKLSDTYRNGGAIKPNLLTLEKALMRAIKLGGVSLFAWNAWLKQYKMLCGVFGL